MENIESVYPVT